MRLSFTALSLALMTASSSSHRIPFKQIRPRSHLLPRASDFGSFQPQLLATASSDVGLDLSTVHDLIYMANITVGGTNYTVQLDTGSSDLWIKGDVHPLPNSNPTSLTTNLTYAIGWAFGNISYAPVEFVEITTQSQALLDISNVQNPALGYGAQGIVGLGFTSLSQIDERINETKADGSGRSLLYNLFQANPSQPNFLAFSLQRSTESDDEVEGTFSIGEFEPEYSSVAGNAPISTWPINSPKRWNVLLDAVIVNSTITIPTTTVVGAPSNKAVVLLDSGSSWTYAPTEICNAIYGNVTGAYYDSDMGQWVVPCSAEIDMALQIGTQVFPIHPLDVTPAGLTDAKTCVGSFVPQNVSVGNGKFDWLIGDNFLRSVYSVYDFGDFDSSGNMGNPYMKLLSIIDPDQASEEFAKARGTTPKSNITYTGLQGVSVAPSFSISNDISNSLDMIGKYLPAMFAIVALNALILIVAVIVGSILYCRKQRKRKIASSRTRTPIGRMSPMPMNPRNSYIPGSGPPYPQPHSYEPVSMALTEDTFVPPSPAFLSEGSKIGPGDRPKSVA